MSSVKGAAITARVRFVRERHGEAGLRRVVAELPAPHRALLEARVLPQAWVPFDLFVDLCTAVDHTFGKGDLALCYEMGRYAAEVNLPTLYRLFFRLGSPDFIFRKASQVWSVHYDSGLLTTHTDAPGAVRLRIARFDRPHRAHCMSVLGWASKSVELSGGALAHAEESRCRTRGDEACELSVMWR